MSERILLDPTIKSFEAQEFENKLFSKVVGQDRAVRKMANLYQVYLSGMASAGRPIGNLLFLGPTGSGKTRVVEAAAEILFGDSKAVLKIDCAEFQHSHEIAQLIGSPPGYLGHRETPPLLTQEAVDQYHTDKLKLTLLLFDEIEKANDALWQLLLGILDKATLTLGDNRRVDMSRAIVFMTSNLGAAEMSEFISGGAWIRPSVFGDLARKRDRRQNLQDRPRGSQAQVLAGVHEPHRQSCCVPNPRCPAFAEDSGYRTGHGSGSNSQLAG